jgi:deoxyribodipyrimidine photolyase-related protein
MEQSSLSGVDPRASRARMTAMTTLAFVLGDQLTPEISALRGLDPARDVVLMAEVADETVYVPHHPKKIAFILAAMRHFADELRARGWTLDYVKLDDPGNTGSFSGELQRAVRRHRPGLILTTEAGEHRVIAMQRGWSEETGLPVIIREDDRFIASHADFAAWAGDRSSLLMEDFYRRMRRRTGLLMTPGERPGGAKPEGGRWNFDKENRKPAETSLFTPKPLRVDPDATTREVLALVDQRFSANFGDLDPFWFAVTRADAQRAFAGFLRDALPQFGRYQDAMLRGEPFLYHSLISLYLNAGLLDPLDVCRRVEAEYRAGRAPLNAAEGFIRQIIGWREYVRGVYFREGPDYVSRNALGATRALPWFYWTGDTEMACMKACIDQTRAQAYAHHIQRLMVTGNFALIAGLDPHAVHEWYLSVYADAYEWVEAPNTIGMSLFADGGLLATKPYAASGAYINRMSDYCAGCRHDVKRRTGPDACPFNYLYWDFVARNADMLSRNPRLGFAATTWAKFPEAEQAAIRASAQAFLDALDQDAAARAGRAAHPVPDR